MPLSRLDYFQRPCAGSVKVVELGTDCAGIDRSKYVTPILTSLSRIKVCQYEDLHEL